MRRDRRGSWASAGAALRRAVGAFIVGFVGFDAGPVMLEAVRTADAADAPLDHALLDRLLGAAVDDDGRVDYARLATRVEELDAYLSSLAAAAIDQLSPPDRLAALLNAYNAFTLRLVMERRPIKSIQDIPQAERWSARRWRLGGRTVSLDDLEHRMIRPSVRDPRVHFALVCAALGCPPLRREAYVGRRLEDQLDDQAARFHVGSRWLRYDAARKTIRLSPIYDWYRDDFTRDAGGILEYATQFSSELRRVRAAGVVPALEFLDYDWALNAQVGRE